VKGDGDRPDFTGKNVNDVPGANNVHVGTGDKLRGGAKWKWDLSRRLRVKALSPNVATAWFDGSLSAATIFDNLPAASQVQEDYPTNDCIGNDDTSTGLDEVYDSLHLDARLTSLDRPRMPALRDAGGANGDTVEFRIQFGEFVRLEIAGKWYRVSHFYNWRHHAKLKKANGTWIDNGSVSDNTNNGW
jgi:hypothetical protein